MLERNSIMTDSFWLEFDEDKLAILKQEAYELDLSLEEYLSEMIEDMVSFNREKTEDEENMDKYKTVKWKDREVESSAIERFSERWTYFIKDEIDGYDVYLEDLAEEDPDAIPIDIMEFTLYKCCEYIEEEMGFPCENLIKETAEDILKYRK